jgi:6-pyruvoyltetrahydropterin/6-carboxytetrahydropterin synthase
VVEVTVKGEVDRVTGMVVNLVHIKSSLENVIDQLDHRNLDVDVPFFKEHVSTTGELTVG